MKRTQSKSAGPHERRARRERLNRRLLGYSATAGAALAVAGAAGTADASIVVDAGFHGPYTVTNNGSLNINMVGGSGKAQSFHFNAVETNGVYGTANQNAVWNVLAIKGASILAVDQSATKLNLNGAIGPARPWTNGYAALAFSTKGWPSVGVGKGGSFLGTTGYIGVRFADPTTPAQTDYGWIEYAANDDATVGTIDSWAYDNSGAAVGAGEVPEPTSLAVWALGALSAAGVAVLRRWKKED